MADLIITQRETEDIDSMELSWEEKLWRQHEKELEATRPVSTRISGTAYKAVRLLFAEPFRGFDFVQDLLDGAQVIQRQIPGQEILDDIAVVTVQNVRELAKKIKWGYDTTHRYLLVFCALGLIHKQRHEGKLQILFPLKIYFPSPNVVDTLDKIIETSRPKARQLARQVRERYVLAEYEITAEVTDDPSLRPPQPLLNQIEDILSIEGIDYERRRRLTLKIAKDVIVKVMRSTSSHTNEKEPSASTNISCPIPAASEAKIALPAASEIKTRAEATLPARFSSVSNIQTPPKTVVATTTPISQQKTTQHNENTSGSDNTAQDQKVSQLPKKSPTLPPAENNIAPNVIPALPPGIPKIGPEDQLDPEQTKISRINRVDITKYSQDFQRNVTLNVKEFILNNYINVTLRRELTIFFAETFDDDSSKAKFYPSTIDKCDPENIMKAMLHVLQSLHSTGYETISNKGAFFLGTCIRLQDENKKLSANTGALVRQYAHLTYENLLDALEVRAAEELESRKGAKQTSKHSRGMRYAKHGTNSQGQKQTSFRTKRGSKIPTEM